MSGTADRAEPNDRVLIVAASDAWRYANHGWKMLGPWYGGTVRMVRP